MTFPGGHISGRLSVGADGAHTEVHQFTAHNVQLFLQLGEWSSKRRENYSETD